MGDFPKCEGVTLQFEGGKVDDPRDPGGRTNQGVTQRTYLAWRQKEGLPAADVFVMTPDERNMIYRSGYWDPIRGDELVSGVDLAAFDYGVNSGVEVARKALMVSTGLLPVAQVKAICARRLSLLHGLRTWAYFGKGWNARVAKVEALGIAWAGGAEAVTQSVSEANSKVKKHGSGAVIAAGGGAGAVTQGHSPEVIILTTLIALAVIAAFGFFAWRNQQRIAALVKVMKGI